MTAICPDYFPFMKIKLLYIQETIGTGGVEQTRLSLVKCLNKEKYEIKIICTFKDGPIVKKIENENVQVISIGQFKHILDFKQYKKVFSIIKEFKPHIIHGAVFEGVTMACVAGFLARVPVIIAEETSDPQNRTKKASFLLKVLTTVADKVVAIAPSVALYLRDVAGIPEQKICLINNGVSIPPPVAQSQVDALKSKYNILPDDIVIGSVGRLHNDHKRYTDIIEAIALLQHNKHIKLLIVGSGSDEKLLIDTAEKAGLAGQLILAGYQSDMGPYYAIMNVFCLASQREGFGLVAAEAMLHKLPVIASRVGGLKDVVIDQETGFLVPPLSPNLLAEKIGILLSDPELGKRLGNAGYKRACREYTADVYSTKVDALYRELLISKGILK